ncbi:ATPase subunit of ABC transporter with duplicated ATPase domains [Anaerosolibacter carboniphilus]|uniref:ATPase subunit of ABC transporter with duplicated ATPase domains n=1 Tax=Anaerosolibacter carboniphilus TaxID=1417629 RepID=A0A841KW92_9FIRM|nr:ABC-F type ribosomal protection protein [Anaerosolibacter carboniphilus]MBB6217643.1 ATPase subunit of ABC transporter with duplicated ATPase domains [Anaerosolibacter carboniphilus]
MIEIALKELEKYYGAHRVLHSISFEVLSHEKVGLVGANGTGKTTIFKIISGLENYDGGMLAVRKGASIGYLHQIPDGQEHITVNDVLYEAFGTVMDIKKSMELLEEQMSALQCLSLEHAVKKYGELQLAFESKGGYTIEESFSKICTGLKITEDFRSRRFSTLSGGEKTTVQLGKILLLNPDILLLDEPTNHLDLDSIEWLENFIANYKGSVLIISHDRYFLDAAVNKIIEIEDGEATAYAGNYSYYVAEKDRMLMEQFDAFKDQQKKIKAMEEAIARFRDWGNRSGNPKMFIKIANMEKRIARMDKVDRPIMERRKIQLQFQSIKSSSKDVVRIQGLKKSYGSQPLLEDINLHIRSGERVALLGKNGTGKSTLIKGILSQYIPDAGEIKVGSNVQIGYLEQDIIFPKPQQTALEAFRENLAISEGEARRILAKFLFCGEDVFRKVENLSGGQKSRLKLCQLMMQDLHFLILDEPTNHLDIDSREMLEEALDDFTGTILFISHDRYFINKLADRIVELQGGRLVDYLGNYDYYREKRMFQVKAAPIVHKTPKPFKEIPVKSVDDQRQKEHRISNIEQEIEALQKLIQEKDEYIKALSSDYEKLQTAFAEKETFQNNLDVLMEEWLLLQE